MLVALRPKGGLNEGGLLLKSISFVGARVPPLEFGTPCTAHDDSFRDSNRKVYRKFPVEPYRQVGNGFTRDDELPVGPEEEVGIQLFQKIIE